MPRPHDHIHRVGHAMRPTWAYSTVSGVGKGEERGGPEWAHEGARGAPPAATRTLGPPAPRVTTDSSFKCPRCPGGGEGRAGGGGERGVQARQGS